MKRKLLLLIFIAFVFSSFIGKTSVDKKLPGTMTRTLMESDGNQLEKTVIVIDGNTSREDIINTCAFLAHENVQLTFDRLIIGKSFLGVIGKKRIRIVEGKISFSDDLSQNFKAGGASTFTLIKIQYSSNPKTKSSRIEMIEIID